ncbi:MAG: putative DNA-invertase from lambdoid prophage Rac [Acetobacteraceae bacterium]|nr:putative DNA-invertase from lambdoid prophage Rac [Acetobacteraceae bacterium]
MSLFLLDLNSGADDVSGNGIARLFLTIVSAFAEFERNRIGERIRATKQAQKARSEFLGSKSPFGWRLAKGRDNRELVPMPLEQAALARMRALRSEGTGCSRWRADQPHGSQAGARCRRSRGGERGGMTIDIEKMRTDIAADTLRFAVKMTTVLIPHDCGTSRDVRRQTAITASEAMNHSQMCGVSSVRIAL